MLQVFSNNRSQIFNFQFSIFNNTGFTLIELMVVFSLMVILSSIGVASFVGYSRSQQVDTNMKELKTALFTARSRALSQLRDTSCFSGGFTGQNYELKGYQLVGCCSFPLCGGATCSHAGDNYELQAIYGYPDGTGITAQTCTNKKFTDPNISIDSTNTTATYFFFASITGAVTTNSGSKIPQLAISGYGITKIATLSATGVIQ